MHWRGSIWASLVGFVLLAGLVGLSWLEMKLSWNDFGLGEVGYGLLGVSWIGVLLVGVPYGYQAWGCSGSLPAFVLVRIRWHLLVFGVVLGCPGEFGQRGVLIVAVGSWVVLGGCIQGIIGVTRVSLFRTLNTGHNLEVLQLEKYLLYGTGEISRMELAREIGLERFYARGMPKPLPLASLFRKWCRTEQTTGSVYTEYGYDLGESMRIPNRPRLTPDQDAEEVEGAISVASLLGEFDDRDANALFALISYGERSRIRYSTFMETFRQISLERTNLYYAIKDCKRLLRHFKRFLAVFEVVLVFWVFSIALGMRNLFLHTFVSFVLVHAVVPGSVSFLESFVFLLVSHPYDNGDRVLVQGVNMLVKKVGLFSTCFCTWSGEYIVIQNNVVSKCPIVNVRRSISQYWAIEIPVSFECDNEAILNLKKRLQWYVQEEKMLTGLIFAPTSIDAGNCVRIRLLVRKNSNFQNGFFTLTNFTKCLACIIRIVTEEGLYYKPPIARTRVPDQFLDEIYHSNQALFNELAAKS
ncbi:hypothetical protein NEHOM01_0062 [Nematocida homosporus]|uniref:uncharacterized protein n=1 Tax=Nematocida homosporus TaxID=1912981 RepID=UPI002220D48E|nr:uncharacterized protein NEHOM01_0062 [Nematocida homosporus]KAI5184317.1 hypothetical protein NEHOM01_0062 [Nematocida homosporus]